MDFGGFKTRMRTLGRAPISDPEAGGVFNERYKEMVGRAKWRMAEVTVDTTVTGQSDYPIADDIVDLEELLVGSMPYDRVSTAKLFRLRAGRLRLVNSAGEGVFAPSYDSGAVRSIALYPAPEIAGDAITGLAAVLPPELTSETQVPDVPADIHRHLADGCMATVLGTVDRQFGEAAQLEQSFEQGISLLTARKNSRIGSAPTRIAIAGVDF